MSPDIGFACFEKLDVVKKSEAVYVDFRFPDVSHQDLTIHSYCVEGSNPKTAFDVLLKLTRILAQLVVPTLLPRIS